MMLGILRRGCRREVAFTAGVPPSASQRILLTTEIKGRRSRVEEDDPDDLLDRSASRSAGSLKWPCSRSTRSPHALADEAANARRGPPRPNRRSAPTGWSPLNHRSAPAAWDPWEAAPRVPAGKILWMRSGVTCGQGWYSDLEGERFFVLDVQGDCRLGASVRTGRGPMSPFGGPPSRVQRPKWREVAHQVYVAFRRLQHVTVGLVLGDGTPCRGHEGLRAAGRSWPKEISAGSPSADSSSRTRTSHYDHAYGNFAFLPATCGATSSCSAPFDPTAARPIRPGGGQCRVLALNYTDTHITPPNKPSRGG